VTGTLIKPARATEESLKEIQITFKIKHAFDTLGKTM